MIDELSMRFAGFDFAAAMRELQQWQDELSTDLEDEIIYAALEGVKDLIIDNCTFE